MGRIVKNLLVILFIGYGLVFGMEEDKKDTLKIEEKEKISFWKKLGFSIGYSGGFNWATDELSKPFYASPVAGFSQLPDYIKSRIYWINNINLEILYKFKDDQIYKFHITYGYSNLGVREGLSMNVLIEGTQDYGFVSTSHWKMNFWKIGFSFLPGIFLRLGGYLCLFKATTVEQFYPPYSTVPSEDNLVKREGCGWEIFLKIESNKGIKDLLFPFISMSIGNGIETWNDSPWKWKKKLHVSFSSFLIGINLEIKRFKE